jgi:hypothetical protein
MNAGAGDGCMCPSTSAANATVVLGIVLPSGRVAYATPAVAASPALVEALSDDPRPLESRYRFAGPCVESRCGFWTGAGCGLGAAMADSYADVAGEQASDAALPRCSIRPRCRWYAEQGARACAACPLIVTDTRTAEPAL